MAMAVFPHQLLRFIILMDSAQNGASAFRSSSNVNFQRFLGLGHRLTGLDLQRGGVRLGKRVEVNHFLKRGGSIFTWEKSTFSATGLGAAAPRN